MWQLDNQTPFAAERGWVRGRDGSEIWLVAVKATFDIHDDGSTTETLVQPPVLRLPEYHGEPGQSSLRYDADLVLTKVNTDIIVVGHAYAPAGMSVTHIDAGFKLGSVQKLVRVFGDRTWGSLSPTEPTPFQKMPLVYERGYGGVDRRSETPGTDWDWRNPVGTGYAVCARNAAGLKLPNIENPQALISDWRDRPAPAGLGAVASHWQPRVGLAGTYGEHWQTTQAPLLAADMDERWFQSAPADQQAAGFLRGGEPVTLHNLSPRGRLQFALPALQLRFETRFYDGSRRAHEPPCLHAVILEPDLPRVSLVWHTALPCHHLVHKLQTTHIRWVAGCADVAPGQSTRTALA